MLDKNYIKNLIGKTKDIILVEVGAADGGDTLEFVEVFKDTDFILYAFEPDKRNIQTFKQKINDPRVILVESAVGDVDGKVEFNTSIGQNIYSSSLKEPGQDIFKIWSNLFNEKSFEKTQVNCVTLEKFCAEKNIDHIDFAWIDCQGAEDLLIRGAGKYINKIDYIYTEYSNAEIYKNEPNLDKILFMLPNFEVIQIYKNTNGDLQGGDVLLKRIK